MNVASNSFPASENSSMASSRNTESASPKTYLIILISLMFCSLWKVKRSFKRMTWFLSYGYVTQCTLFLLLPGFVPQMYKNVHLISKFPVSFLSYTKLDNIKCREKMNKKNKRISNLRLFFCQLIYLIAS
jgi:hypothetical protein